jgi:hypothetical protein
MMRSGRHEAGWPRVQVAASVRRPMWASVHSDQHLRQHRQHREHVSCLFSIPATTDWPPAPLLRGVPTMLTVLTLSSALVLTLMILVPPRPARENVISMPSVRRNVCVRRRRPASARGLMGSASMMLSIAA